MLVEPLLSRLSSSSSSSYSSDNNDSDGDGALLLGSAVCASYVKLVHDCLEVYVLLN
jgi:hypothetical protein